MNVNVYRIINENAKLDFEDVIFYQLFYDIYFSLPNLIKKYASQFNGIFERYGLITLR